MKKLTLEEAKSIVLAEKAHWEKFNSDMSIGAIGACANIYAALCGIRAPWHPEPKSSIGEKRLINEALSKACRPPLPDHGRDV